MKNDNTHKVGLSDVLRAFWKGIKPQQAAMYFTLFAYTTTSILYVLVPLVYKRFFDILTTSSPVDSVSVVLVELLLLVFAINLVALLFMRIAFWVLNGFESSTMARLKQMAFDYMINHSYSFFSNNFTGSLVQRVNRFSRSFERLYDTLVFQIVPLIVNVIGALVVVWYQKPLIAKIIFVWILVVMTLNYLFSRWKVKYDIASAAADSHTTAVLSDNVTNQNTIMLFNNFQAESELFKKTTESQARAQRLSWNLSTTFDGVQMLLIAMVEFAIFYYAVQYWEIGAITIGTFVLIQAYIIGLSQKLWDFGRIIRNLYETFADSKEMVEILAKPHDIKNLPGAKDLVVKDGVIEFKDVLFNFNETRPVLEGLVLKINGGEKIALIGPSGAGKSTIIRILLRMYDLTAGSVLIDGQDIKNLTQESLRENISLVPQDPVLFHRSLLENIRYGKLTATDSEAIEAASLAHCDEFIEQLPLKYETLVGERGIKLSGGERQRIAIARAILKNAPILVLDEATSSLDSHSESLIQDALDKLMKGKTSIVIAHRLSTIRKMDRIIVIENGKVIEDGDHDTLLTNEGSLYKKLWDLQAGGFIKED